MQTVLTLVNDTLGEINLPAVSSLITSPTQSTTQLVKLLRTHARALRLRRVWPQQKKQWVFNTVAGRARYPLPQDYYAALPGTEWDDTRRWRLLGPMTDLGFTNRTRGSASNSTQSAFRIFGPDFNPTTGGGQFEVDPVPTAAIELSFEYITSNLFLPPHWTISEAVTTTTYRNANGLNWKLKTNGTTSATTPPVAPTVITSDVTDNTAVWNVYQPAYETPITDSDLCLFDDEVMIAGLKWRFLKAAGLDFENEKAEAEQFLNGAAARLQGSVIGRLDSPKTAINNKSITTQGSWPL